MTARSSSKIRRFRFESTGTNLVMKKSLLPAECRHEVNHYEQEAKKDAQTYHCSGGHDDHVEDCWQLYFI